MSAVGDIRGAVDRLGDDGISIGVGGRRRHGNSANEDDPDGTECSERSEGVARTCHDTLSPRGSWFSRFLRGNRNVGVRHPRHCEIAPHEDECHGNHAVRIGTHAAKEPEVLNEHPVSEAEHDPSDYSDPSEPSPAGHEQQPDGPEAYDQEQVDRPAVRRIESGETAQPGREEPRLGGLGHYAAPSR